MSETQIYINKTLAAQRQIRCAIRLFFLGEEPMAVHALTSSATSLCNDILRDRGKDLITEVQLQGMIQFSHDYARGLLTEDLVELAQKMEQIDPVLFDFFRQNPEANSSDVEFTGRMPNHQIRAFWNDQRKVWNFLKHADRDTDSFISESDINNSRDIIWAMGAYAHVSKDTFEEGKAFLCWTHFYDKNVHYKYDKLHEPYHTFFEEFDESAAKLVCYLWLSLAYQGKSFHERVLLALAALQDNDLQFRFLTKLGKKPDIDTDVSGQEQ